MLLVQKLLLDGTTPEQLWENYGISVRKVNHKIGLNYDQIHAQDSDPVSQQCRGLILNASTFEIMACPMFRFFNYGQGAAANIDWTQAKIQEKVDGTLCIVYWDPVINQWCLGTRNCPEANLKIDSLCDLTFTTLFEKGLNCSLQEFGQTLSKTHTYCFELCSPLNQILVYYPEIKIYLLSVRNNITLIEESIQDWAAQIKIDPPAEYPFTSIDQLLIMVRDWDPSEHEGVVAKSGFNRIKIKNPQHAARNILRDLLQNSPRKVVETIILGKEDDILPYMSSLIQERVLAMKSKIAKVLTRIETDWEKYKHINEQKEFALTIQKEAFFTPPLYNLKKGHISSVKEYFVQYHPNGLDLAPGMMDKLLELVSRE